MSRRFSGPADERNHLGLEVQAHDGASFTALGEVDGLPGDPLTVRLVADPVRRIGILFVNEAPYPSFMFPTFSGSLPKHKLFLYDAGSQGKFDYVHVTQSSAS
jgi:hypothetical protein